MGALTYVATMDDFSRFRNGRSVSKRFGPAPTRHDSGEKAGRNGKITQAGDTTVRKAVVEGLASLPNHDKAQKWLPKAARPAPRSRPRRACATPATSTAAGRW